MKQTTNILLILAVLAFLVGTLARFFSGGVLLGNEAVVYWRGAMGFLAFAIALILLQIRDR
jgi:hypothetical protein